MLRRDSPGGGWVEAVRIDLATQEGERFRPAPGFHEIAIEEMLAPR